MEYLPFVNITKIFHTDFIDFITEMGLFYLYFNVACLLDYASREVAT